MSDKEYDLDEFINGTMDEDARAKFEAMLAQDSELQQEAEFTGKLREGLKHQQATPPGEFGLARLQRSIKQHEQEQSQAAPKTRVWKPVAIAASALLLLQSSILMFNQSQETTVDIQTLSGSEQITTAQIQLVFKADAPIAAIQSLLQQVNASIVGGPGALGIYQVQLADSTDISTALVTLRASEWTDSVSVR